MEFVVPILIVIGLFTLVLTDKRKDRRKIRRLGSDKIVHVNFARQSFDSETAEAVSSKQELEGFARIVDGDTLVVRKTQIRLFGVDAPELNHPFGQKAKWALVSLCKGQRVRVVLAQEDAYGRTVAKCYLQDGRDLSAEMVKLGLAIDWAKYSGGVYLKYEVQNARKRLWLADARQKGRMHVWEAFEAQQKAKGGSQS